MTRTPVSITVTNRVISAREGFWSIVTLGSDDVGLKKRFRNYVLAQMWGITKPAGDESGAGAALLLFEVREKVSADDKKIHALLLAIAKTSGELAAHAGKYFDPKVPGLKRIRNSYSMIWSEPS